MSESPEPLPIAELRSRIQSEIAELRAHYAALMPPLSEPQPWLSAWQPRPVQAPAAGAARATPPAGAGPARSAIRDG